MCTSLAVTSWKLAAHSQALTFIGEGHPVGTADISNGHGACTACNGEHQQFPRVEGERGSTELVARPAYGFQPLIGQPGGRTSCCGASARRSGRCSGGQGECGNGCNAPEGANGCGHGFSYVTPLGYVSPLGCLQERGGALNRSMACFLVLEASRLTPPRLAWVSTRCMAQAWSRSPTVAVLGVAARQRSSKFKRWRDCLVYQHATALCACTAASVVAARRPGPRALAFCVAVEVGTSCSVLSAQ